MPSVVSLKYAACFSDLGRDPTHEHYLSSFNIWQITKMKWFLSVVSENRTAALESLTGREWQIASRALSPLIGHEYQSSMEEKTSHVTPVQIERGHSRDIICCSLLVELSSSIRLW